jgi:hypothetical protein
MLKNLRAALAPDIEILSAGDNQPPSLQQARENVGFLHRKAGDVDFYFISNISRGIACPI